MYYLIKRHLMIHRVSEQLQEDNRDKIIDYFMNIKYKVKAEELRLLRVIN
jgi:hypothetical protein